MEYNFREIEQKWSKEWKIAAIYEVSNDSPKPKYYVLDMFPYPSGSGLHVGHPLGYIASDIFARFKRLKGFNVLHPMGFDSFGLPAEQYALETGQHPATTTEKNITTFKNQLDKIGFCYDWSREVRTSDPTYYRWTQWIFLQLFESWYNPQTRRAEPLAQLVRNFNANGTGEIENHTDHRFSSDQWNAFSEKEKQEVLMDFRLAFSSFGEVNWCEALGTVLANDEVINGFSERGGHPVEKKKMRQWYLRITDYADRLLEGLDTVDFSDAMKEMQRNWIGKSEGAELEFQVEAAEEEFSAAEFGLTPNSSPEGEGGDPKPNTFKTADRKSWPLLKDLSRENGKEKTLAEEILWQRLRNNQFGSKVRRQHVIAGFIIDFAFLNERLLIEVDGEYHTDIDQTEYDESRTRFLESLGFRVIRFTNEEVLKELPSVSERIKVELAASPLSGGRGAGNEAKNPTIKVYTTRPDTIFGVDFLVLAPEHELVEKITTSEQKHAVEEYLAYVKSRSDRERLSEVKQITGCFTGAYAINPFNQQEIPVWIAEYVLAGYGTGAIMAVPCGDQRDFAFAKHFDIPVTNIIGDHFNGQEANPTKDAVLGNSGFLTGILMKDAISVAIDKIEDLGIGKRKINYRMRDAGFSRQRYWGEPFPITWSDGIPVPLPQNELPLELPHVEKYGPGKNGEGPLSNLTDWVNTREGMRETSTMPGYAGSSWYFLRYMDPHNNETFAGRKATDYWNQVDVYIGGTEHAVGHLLYSRLWTKVLFDLGLISFDEPFKKLVNQGMIQGSSRFVYRVKDSNTFVSSGLKDNYEVSPIHIDVNIVNGTELNLDAFRQKKPEYASAEFLLEDGKYICGSEVEKMSKSKYNTVNPDDLVEKYGADTFRMYEMFLGPVEQSKPWDTKGIEGVHRFLKKLWRLFYDENTGPLWNAETATPAELKVLHKAIKKIQEDTERFSFNTAVSGFMVCVNELTELKCHKVSVLSPLLILLAPYAPHIAEELFHAIGNEGFVMDATYPKLEVAYLAEAEKEYPVSVNGKMRSTVTIASDADQKTAEKMALENEVIQKWIEGKQVKKIIFVKNKMINIVV